jgi:hypothetical protein
MPWTFYHWFYSWQLPYVSFTKFQNFSTSFNHVHSWNTISTWPNFIFVCPIQIGLVSIYFPYTPENETSIMQTAHVSVEAGSETFGCSWCNYLEPTLAAMRAVCLPADYWLLSADRALSPPAPLLRLPVSSSIQLTLPLLTVFCLTRTVSYTGITVH